jgi:hypothetical protein
MICFISKVAMGLTIEIGEHENGVDSIKTKAQILKFLKDSFADLRKATGTLDEENLMNPTNGPVEWQPSTPLDVCDNRNISSLGNVRTDGHIFAHEWN